MLKHQLREYCEAEFENIDTVVFQLFSIVKAEKPGYSTAELAAIATFIHNCYNGVENILKRILSFNQIEMKETPTWHKDLLKTSLDIGIITDNLYSSLSDYLSFRYFFVHAYSFTLRWDELKPLVEDLEKTLKRFRSAIYSFIDKHD